MLFLVIVDLSGIPAAEARGDMAAAPAIAAADFINSLLFILYYLNSVMPGMATGTSYFVSSEISSLKRISDELSAWSNVMVCPE